MTSATEFPESVVSNKTEGSDVNLATPGGTAPLKEDNMVNSELDQKRLTASNIGEKENTGLESKAATSEGESFWESPSVAKIACGESCQASEAYPEHEKPKQVSELMAGDENILQSGQENQVSIWAGKENEVEQEKKQSLIENETKVDIMEPIEAKKLDTEAGKAKNKVEGEETIKEETDLSQRVTMNEGATNSLKDEYNDALKIHDGTHIKLEMQVSKGLIELPDQIEDVQLLSASLSIDRLKVHSEEAPKVEQDIVSATRTPQFQKELAETSFEDDVYREVDYSPFDEISPETDPSEKMDIEQDEMKEIEISSKRDVLHSAVEERRGIQVEEATTSEVGIGANELLEQCTAQTREETSFRKSKLLVDDKLEDDKTDKNDMASSENSEYMSLLTEDVKEKKPGTHVTETETENMSFQRKEDTVTLKEYPEFGTDDSDSGSPEKIKLKHEVLQRNVRDVLGEKGNTEKNSEEMCDDSFVKDERSLTGAQTEDKECTSSAENQKITERQCTESKELMFENETSLNRSLKETDETETRSMEVNAEETKSSASCDEAQEITGMEKNKPIENIAETYKEEKSDTFQNSEKSEVCNSTESETNQDKNRERSLMGLDESGTEECESSLNVNAQETETAASIDHAEKIAHAKEEGATENIEESFNEKREPNNVKGAEEKEACTMSCVTNQNDEIKVKSMTEQDGPAIGNFIRSLHVKSEKIEITPSRNHAEKVTGIEHEGGTENLEESIKEKQKSSQFEEPEKPLLHDDIRSRTIQSHVVTQQSLMEQDRAGSQKLERSSTVNSEEIYEAGISKQAQRTACVKQADVVVNIEEASEKQRNPHMFEEPDKPTPHEAIESQMSLNDDIKDTSLMELDGPEMDTFEGPSDVDAEKTSSAVSDHAEKVACTEQEGTIVDIVKSMKGKKRSDKLQESEKLEVRENVASKTRQSDEIREGEAMGQDGAGMEEFQSTLNAKSEDIELSALSEHTESITMLKDAGATVNCEESLHEKKIPGIPEEFQKPACGTIISKRGQNDTENRSLTGQDTPGMGMCQRSFLSVTHEEVEITASSDIAKLLESGGQDGAIENIEASDKKTKKPDNCEESEQPELCDATGKRKEIDETVEQSSVEQVGERTKKFDQPLNVNLEHVESAASSDHADGSTERNEEGIKENENSNIFKEPGEPAEIGIIASETNVNNKTEGGNLMERDGPGMEKFGISLNANVEELASPNDHAEAAALENFKENIQEEKMCEIEEPAKPEMSDSIASKVSQRDEMGGIEASVEKNDNASLIRLSEDEKNKVFLVKVEESNKEKILRGQQDKTTILQTENPPETHDQKLNFLPEETKSAYMIQVAEEIASRASGITLPPYHKERDKSKTKIGGEVEDNDINNEQLEVEDTRELYQKGEPRENFDIISCVMPEKTGVTPSSSKAEIDTYPDKEEPIPDPIDYLDAAEIALRDEEKETSKSIEEDVKDLNVGSLREQTEVQGGVSATGKAPTQPKQHAEEQCYTIQNKSEIVWEAPTEEAEEVEQATESEGIKEKKTAEEPYVVSSSDQEVSEEKDCGIVSIEKVKALDVDENARSPANEHAEDDQEGVPKTYEVAQDLDESQMLQEDAEKITWVSIIASEVSHEDRTENITKEAKNGKLSTTLGTSETEESIQESQQEKLMNPIGLHRNGNEKIVYTIGKCTHPEKLEGNMMHMYQENRDADEPRETTRGYYAVFEPREQLNINFEADRQSMEKNETSIEEISKDPTERAKNYQSTPCSTEQLQEVFSILPPTEQKHEPVKTTTTRGDYEKEGQTADVIPRGSLSTKSEAPLSEEQPGELDLTKNMKNNQHDESDGQREIVAEELQVNKQDVAEEKFTVPLPESSNTTKLPLPESSNTTKLPLPTTHIAVEDPEQIEVGKRCENPSNAEDSHHVTKVESSEDMSGETSTGFLSESSDTTGLPLPTTHIENGVPEQIEIGKKCDKSSTDNLEKRVEDSYHEPEVEKPGVTAKLEETTGKEEPSKKALADLDAEGGQLRLDIDTSELTMQQGSIEGNTEAIAISSGSPPVYIEEIFPPRQEDDIAAQYAQEETSKKQQYANNGNQMIEMTGKVSDVKNTYPAISAVVTNEKSLPEEADDLNIKNTSTVWDPENREHLPGEATAELTSRKEVQHDENASQTNFMKTVTMNDKEESKRNPGHATTEIGAGEALNGEVAEKMDELSGMIVVKHISGPTQTNKEKTGTDIVQILEEAKECINAPTERATAKEETAPKQKYTDTEQSGKLNNTESLEKEITGEKGNIDIVFNENERDRVSREKMVDSTILNLEDSPEGNKGTEKQSDKHQILDEYHNKLRANKCEDTQDKEDLKLEIAPGTQSEQEDCGGEGKSRDANEETTTQARDLAEISLQPEGKMPQEKKATISKEILQSIRAETLQFHQEKPEEKDEGKGLTHEEKDGGKGLTHEEKDEGKGLTHEDSDEGKGLTHEEKDSGSNAPVKVECSDGKDAKIAHKKSHNMLSGVGSKVKHSIAKVRKVITGKSSHKS